MNVRAVGQYIRTQRTNSRLSLRKMSGLAGVSIPYLSQIERGLRRPSAEILQAIAKGLRISAETLYVQAGILEARPRADVASAILADPAITERQRQALIQIYQAFREEAARQAPAASPSRRTPKRPAANRPTAKRATAKRPTAKRAVPRPKTASRSRDDRTSRAINHRKEA